MWLDRIGHTITEPVHVDTAARCIAALEDIEREANAKACLVANNRAAKIKAGLAALIPFGLDVNGLVAATRTSRACGLRSTG